MPLKFPSTHLTSRVGRPFQIGRISLSRKTTRKKSRLPTSTCFPPDALQTLARLHQHPFSASFTSFSRYQQRASVQELESSTIPRDRLTTSLPSKSPSAIVTEQIANHMCSLDALELSKLVLAVLFHILQYVSMYGRRASRLNFREQYSSFGSSSSLLI